MGASVGNNNSAGYTSEINITPLVDVVLVLLIIFMVIVPVMMRGHDVNVPGESTAGPADMDRPEQIVLYIEEANCPVFDEFGWRSVDFAPVSPSLDRDRRWCCCTAAGRTPATASGKG